MVSYLQRMTPVRSLTFIIVCVITFTAGGQDLVPKGKLKANDSTSVHLALHVGESFFVLDDINEIAREDLIHTDRLVVTIGYPDHGLRWEIVGFTVVTLMNDSVVEAVSNKAELTDEQKAILGKAPAGSKLYLVDVRVRDGNGPVRHLAGRVILVE